MPDVMNEVYFHEDDYCQQELLPLAAMEFCRQQITEIDDFSAAHQAPGGMGWTDMFMREESPESLINLGISVATLRDTLTAYLPEIPVVCTGYGSHQEICKHTIGFGFDAACVVYAEWKNEDVVTNIWTGLFTPDAAELRRAVDSLQLLGRRYPLLYVDWAWSFATALDQSSSLMDRIASKVTEIARRMEKED